MRSMEFHSIGLCTWRHVDVCKCSPAEGERRKKRDGKTHILASLHIIFLQKIPTVSQRQSSSSPSNSQSTARRCVVLGSLDRRVWSGLAPGVELDWYQVPLRSFAASCWRNRRKLVSQRVFFLFFFIFFRNFVPNIYSERSWLRKTYLYSSSPPGLCEDPSTSCPLTL